MASNQKKKLVYTYWVIGIAILALLIILISKSPTTQNTSVDDQPAATDVVKKVTSVSASVMSAVGKGTSTTAPAPISAPSLAQNGKPTIVYMGAEYCPYCATERWAMIIALSKFGTFTNLKYTHSSTTDVYPNTQTFSFHKSTYTSPYIVFEPVEQYSNIPQGNGYETLDTPTSAQQALSDKYDAPPYVSSSNQGAIPFIDFNGQFLISGATYSPAVLQGKSYEQISSALSNASDPITQGAVGAANTIDAAICKLTKEEPMSVCSNEGVKVASDSL